MILYSKFSNDRRAELSIRTDILADETGKRSVRKAAACPEAEPHIRHIAEACQRLTRLYEGSPFSINQGSLSGNAVILEYLTGRTLEEDMDDLLEDYPAFLEKLAQYLAAVRTLTDTTFEKTGEFGEIFGEYEFPSDTPCVSTADIDMLLNNIIVGQSWQVIDYEWTFFFPVPTDFLVWRILHYYINASIKTSGKRAFLLEKDLFGHFGIDPESCLIYDKMERNFQKYVDGSHIALRHLYPEISKGLVRINGNFDLYTETDKSYEVTYRSAFEEGRAGDLESTRSNEDGHLVLEAKTRGASAFDIFIEEVPMILHLNRLTVDGSVWPLDRLSHLAILINGQDFILTAGNHHFRVEGLDERDHELVFDVTGERLDPRMTGLWGHLANQIAAEHHAAAVRESVLATELQKSLQRVRRDEDMMELRSNAAIELSQTKAMKTYAKVRQKAGKADPFDYLRPHIDPKEAEIYYNIDGVRYQDDHLTIEGWVCDLLYDRINLRLFDGDGGFVANSIRHFAREDVKSALDIENADQAGFEITVPYEAFKRLPLTLDIEDPRGYFRVELPVDQSKLKRG